jgi:DNA-binding transcriptional regulator YiaG
MRFYGKVYRDGRHWLVEIPLLDAMTQGRTKKEAYAMAADLVESLVGRPGFKAHVYRGKAGELELEGSPTRLLIALALRRQRQASGLSLAQVARRMGARSRNTYARYEQGVSVPTIEKLNELLRVVTSGRDVVLRLSDAA